MIVTQQTRDAMAMFRYARQLGRSVHDKHSDGGFVQSKIEDRFGRDSVNWIVTLLTYKRRWRALRV
jgi:hypothetical protein